MFNPISSCKSPLSSRIALPIALLLAGIFGLGISLTRPESITNLTFRQAPAQADDGHGGPSAASPSQPVQVETTAPAPTVDDIVEFCSRHVTERRSFVVFKRGTVVVINEPCKDPMTEARKILARCKDAGARFLTEPTADGDMIVAFKDPVFYRFSQTEVAAIQPWLNSSAVALLTPEETTAAGEGWLPPENARIGLLARRRMLEDAANAVPVKVIRSKDRAIASR